MAHCLCKIGQSGTLLDPLYAYKVETRTLTVHDGDAEELGVYMLTLMWNATMFSDDISGKRVILVTLGYAKHIVLVEVLNLQA